MDGDSKLSGHITKRIIRRSLLFVPLTLLLTAAAVWMLSRWLDWGSFTDAWLQSPGTAGSAAAGGGGASALLSAASGSEANSGREPNGAGVVSKGSNLGGLRRSGGSTGSSMDFSDPSFSNLGGGGGGGAGPLHWDLTAAPRQRQTISSNAGTAAKSWVVAGGSSSSNVGGVGGVDFEDDAERGNSGRGLSFAVSGDGSKQKRVQNASTADLHSLASTTGWAPLTSLANAVTRASNALKTAVQLPSSLSPAAADLEKPKPGSGLPPLSGVSTIPKDATKDSAANGGSSSSGSSSSGVVLSYLSWFASPLMHGGPVVRLCIYIACLLAAIVFFKGLVWYAYVYRKPEILSAVTTYFSKGSYDAIAVEGQVSVFTLLVMTYDVRKVTLQAFVRHYSRCPSVGDIVVVWNKGIPPDPKTVRRGALLQPAVKQSEPTLPHIKRGRQRDLSYGSSMYLHLQLGHHICSIHI